MKDNKGRAGGREVGLTYLAGGSKKRRQPLQEDIPYLVLQPWRKGSGSLCYLAGRCLAAITSGQTRDGRRRRPAPPRRPCIAIPPSRCRRRQRYQRGRGSPGSAAARRGHTVGQRATRSAHPHQGVFLGGTRVFHRGFRSSWSRAQVGSSPCTPEPLSRRPLLPQGPRLGESAPPLHPCARAMPRRPMFPRLPMFRAQRLRAPPRRGGCRTMCGGRGPGARNARG
jgi:hypothetical protein